MRGDATGRARMSAPGFWRSARSAVAATVMAGSLGGALALVSAVVTPQVAGATNTHTDTFGASNCGSWKSDTVPVGVTSASFSLTGGGGGEETRAVPVGPVGAAPVGPRSRPPPLASPRGRFCGSTPAAAAGAARAAARWLRGRPVRAQAAPRLPTCAAARVVAGAVAAAPATRAAQAAGRAPCAWGPRRPTAPGARS